MTDVITRDELYRLPKKRKKTAYPEHKIQRAIIDHVKVFKQPDLTWYHIPNGSTVPRGKLTLIRLAQIGMWAGVPDLYFSRPAHGFPGAVYVYYLEVKGPDGSVSKDQRAAQAWLKGQGANVATCYSVEGGIEQLTKWGLLR
jgi:hypothetical protein